MLISSSLVVANELCDSTTADGWALGARRRLRFELDTYLRFIEERKQRRTNLSLLPSLGPSTPQASVSSADAHTYVYAK